MKMPAPGRTMLALLGRHALALLLCGLLGLLLDQIFAVLFFGALGSLLWHLGHLWQFERWLNGGDTRELPPVADDTWRGIYRRFHELDRRSRKRKRKLNRIVRRFRDGVAALPAGIVVLDNGHRLEWFSRTAQQMFGFSQNHDLGQPVTALVRSPDFFRFLSRWPEQDSVLLRAPADDHLLLRVRLVRFGKHQLLLLATDVTDAHRLERTRRDFVANASHELRTPLTVMVGYLEALLDQPAPDPVSPQARLRQPLLHMQSQAGRMQRIVDDLMLLSELETSAVAPFKPVAVPALLATVAGDARALSGERGHRIELHADGSLWLNGDERELHSAFSNLLFNAVRHTPPGSRIAVRWFVDDGKPCLTVEDDGEGIAPHHLQRLSERFYRVDRGRQRQPGDPSAGTGLGLAIVKHVMQRHDGELQIDSEVGIGSSFSCRFPARLGVPTTGPTAAATREPLEPV